MPVLCVGLGNPGDMYANTRHNVGFIFLDHWATTLGLLKWQEKFKGLVAAINHEKLGKLILLKPQTYMNSSGQSVFACMNFFKLEPKDLIVIHDDLDVPVGNFKIKQKGSHGGHNGLRDIHQAIGTDEYKRIRIGIDRPSEKSLVKDYVLSSFTNSEYQEINKVISELTTNLSFLLL